MNSNQLIFKFSQKSLDKLKTVDKRLQLLANEVIKISPYDFAITCGYRTKQEQQEVFKGGASGSDGIKNLSKHQLKKAIDIMCYDENKKGTWEHKYYTSVADVFKQKSKELHINIRWGGDFITRVDMPHFELIF